MNIDPTGHIKPIQEMLSAISARQKMTSDNIANAHTPGYTAKSTSFSELLFSMNSPFETRLSKQMGSSLVQGPLTESGDPVSLQKELIELQKNMMFYNMTTRRLSSIFTELKTATQIGR